MTILEAPARTRLRLTGAERARLARLAEELTMTPPRLVDDPRWLARARELSCQLPARPAAALRAYRHDPGPAGTIVIGGLPIRESRLPDTPAVPESVQRTASGPAALAVLLGLQLGELTGYRQEKSGALVQNVVPVHGLEQTQSNAGSVALALHVENAFHPYRPDYVGLICLRGDRARQAGTLVCSVREALPLVDPADREVLREPRFVTAAPPSFGTAEQTARQPVLLGNPDDPDVCLDFSATIPLDDAAKGALDRLGMALAAVSATLVLDPGEMAFVDNRIVLHGRTPFTPRYDGQDRWLHRVYVRLDRRRGRARWVPGSEALT